MNNEQTKPSPPQMGECLRAEVRHAEQRLALAQELLRNWIREHPENETKPASIYQTRGLVEIRGDGKSCTEYADGSKEWTVRY